MNSTPARPGSVVVPFVDLALQRDRVADAVRAGIDGVLDNTSFVLGPEVSAFEREFAAYCGVPHVVGVGNGTDALELALRAAGIGRGDEVIVPANTFVATAEAVARAGATAVFADCDDNYLIDPDDAARVAGPRTRAVMAVHLYGQCAPVERLRATLGPDVLIIEDAAQAQGARRFGALAGSLGDVAGTSFYPGKNLGAYGDGGAVMTARDDIAHAIRELRNHGGLARYEHRVLGMNSRLDGIQAAVLSAKLPLLDAWNDERRAAADEYSRLLAGVPDVITPATAEGNDHIFHLYVVRVPDRETTIARLHSDGIAAGVHYPTPVHLLRPFRAEHGSARPLPRAEAFSRDILSLPIYPGITLRQQEYVVDRLARSVRTAVTA
ncbi:DegT/DnrJ/EryC1/StrS aminotransferase family protein [Glaciihabitans sp. dw_435]|uniref:DegT/DnrJ/EryC1/StrS family aminotransferase n=1 Tax=Glaciihabitans sp. dw_435 TaxID=2720081 RepID=UPI001BD3E1B4|nr:DegT/DnrJ/EryC1/StrS family aminotransferase [Glaciihabitans sp. dw_435]